MQPERLRDIRKNELKVTQVKLAESLGCSLRSISDYEAGKSPIPHTIQLALMALKAGLPIK
jgi:predicted transcriptional regulator